MNSLSEYGIIWDVDGTLVDTGELHFLAWVRLFQERGQPFTREDFARTFGRRNREILREMFHPEMSDAECDAIADLKESYYLDSARAQGLSLLPGVRSLLEQFHQAGFAQAIGSSAPRKNLDAIFELTDTTNFFRFITASENVSRGKPDPEVFQVAAAGLGLPPHRCVVFEDAVAGVQAAKAAGMACIAVRFVAHHPHETLQAAGADRIVETLEAVNLDSVRSLLAG
ncbi:HAD family hydrolase [Tuwongella immobilis]|uniref:HAD family phosphatase n=1 Tax=Tuwongella immobilis TaxID=692036 RepID=A0A6C2YN81_9BACT|nr:HAD family phosphatase [Tuwongella immobilis]VIP02896.1 had-superfamily hydrolase : HAD-superfamily hydrolase, subfamily IA, variant 3 OS=Isosphaera pallida (strain ATCC 43644 / DSM 9630 / IS1B) GN=Isop_0814 PE=4 SV=1: HAD_2 [Tuwongella immobilis]VTS02776.1 had-superfamily hydrolase : HAD-superfamily hydrolase, subfamily IA, variant 3 OS=Isosphaera pallida (strain ATCC 43644 / DSM 9630 / IS1B) GN=Isop_0814 PE=4 SV=1: HAD_2 [Tuwongella immobilis]